MEQPPIWVRLARQPVCLVPAHPGIKTLYRDYIMEPTEADKAAYAAWRAKCGDASALPVDVTDAELAAEQRENPGFSLEFCRECAVYRKIVEGLLCEDVVLFHASTVEVDGKAYLFTAPSGTGKSTHTRLWRERLGSRVTMINDDKPLLRFLPDGSVRAYGTPYGGKENIQANTSAPVAGFVVLHQAPENTIRRLTAREAYPFLLNQTYQNWKDTAALARTMDLVYKLAQYPTYELNCTISQQAVTLSYEALTGETLE